MRRLDTKRYRRELHTLMLGWCLLVTVGATIGAVVGWMTRGRA